MKELLSNEAIKQFLGSSIPLEHLPKEFMNLSLRKLAVQFGSVQEEQLNEINKLLKTL